MSVDPNPLVPNIEFPSTDNTSLALAGFVRPTPVDPMPAYDWAARVTRK